MHALKQLKEKLKLIEGKTYQVESDLSFTYYQNKEEEMEEYECNDCMHYDTIEGTCMLSGEDHYGYEEACEKFDKERDTERGEVR